MRSRQTDRALFAAVWLQVQHNEARSDLGRCGDGGGVLVGGGGGRGGTVGLNSSRCMHMMHANEACYAMTKARRPDGVYVDGMSSRKEIRVPCACASGLCGHAAACMDCMHGCAND